MKTWTISDSFGLDHLKLVERPEPVAGPGEIVVQIRAISLNYRDWLVVQGQYNPKMPLPRVLGSDGAGDVVAIGPGVRRVKVGDRVAAIFFQRWLTGEIQEGVARSSLGGDLDGVFAERVVLSEEGVVPIPDSMNFEDAATLPCAAVTAWNALIYGGIKPGQTVLVQGTGGVSIFALQIAFSMGAKVFVISGSDDKLARAMTLGGSAGLNYRQEPAWDKWIRQQTNGLGVDHIVEVGGAGTLERSLRAVRQGGHIALIGVLTGRGSVDPLPIVMRALHVRGIFVGSRAMFEEMNRAFELNSIYPAIDRELSWEKLPEALTLMSQGQHFGKIVLTIPH